MNIGDGLWETGKTVRAKMYFLFATNSIFLRLLKLFLYSVIENEPDLPA